jgi:hypothetical protein
LVERLRRAAPEKRLVIEVNTLEAAIVAASVGFDVIQAEKLRQLKLPCSWREWPQSGDHGPSSRLPAAFTRNVAAYAKRGRCRGDFVAVSGGV